jgi:SAM-dependent methyltransferase
MSHVGFAGDYIERGTNAAGVARLLDDPEVRRRAAADLCPLPPPNQRIHYYGEDHLGYWLSGLADVRALRRLAGDRLTGPILDFGSSSGRVARHWAMEPEGFEVHACELTGRMVDWMSEHLQGRVRGHKTNPLPPLPFDAGSFGFIYAFSVFSHISEAEEAWLEELRRVAKPDATLALTVHNDRTWRRLPDLKFRIKGELEQIDEYRRLREESDRIPDKVAFERNGVHYAFYSNDHIRHVWGRLFDVVSIVDEAHNYQAMVILRPR